MTSKYPKFPKPAKKSLSLIIYKAVNPESQVPSQSFQGGL